MTLTITDKNGMINIVTLLKLKFLLLLRPTGLQCSNFGSWFPWPDVSGAWSIAKSIDWCVAERGLRLPR